MRHLGIAALMTALVACGARDPRPAGGSPQLMPREALSGSSDAGFARANQPREFTFPADHGPHPAFRTEWWYVTGNLESDTGRRFGYQLTIFRNALAAKAPSRTSAWATRDTWLAHFAITDAEGQRMHGFERFSRGALGLAGARANPFRVWLEDWEITSSNESSFFPLTLRATAGAVSIEVELDTTKPFVLQGDQGLSQKSNAPGNASYYYSFTRLRTRGRIEVGETALEVSGSSWLDREWSTSALGDDQVGWDWFALQLGDGREIMFYRLRRADGTTDPVSAGVVVAADGEAARLTAQDVELTETRRWTSSSGATYPLAWRFAIPNHDLSLIIEPVLDAQEHDFIVKYWEGAVDVRAGTDPAGVGYVELTGYR